MIENQKELSLQIQGATKETTLRHSLVKCWN